MTITDKNDTGASARSATPELCAILLTGLQALADAGEADHACRLAGRACAALRDGENGRSWRRFNALLHRLAPRTGPISIPAVPRPQMTTPGGNADHPAQATR